MCASTPAPAKNLPCTLPRSWTSQLASALACGMLMKEATRERLVRAAQQAAQREQVWPLALLTGLPTLLCEQLQQARLPAEAEWQAPLL